jgi:transcription-repair coupling factor (superfamily II helicase)
MTDTNLLSVLDAPVPAKPGERLRWGHLYGNSSALAIQHVSRRHAGPVLVITENTAKALRLVDSLQFYLHGTDLPLLHFPDWETLPYDLFSPHQDIISERIETLYRLPGLDRGILVVPIQTLMQRLSPRDYIERTSR